MTCRIALIHALSHSVAPINDAFARLWPECRRMNLLDDSLASDLASAPAGLDDAMTGRFLALAEYAVSTGVQGILYTCSAFGPCIDAVKARWPHLPVGKPNEAMIEEAATVARAGRRRIALVATYAPTLASMPAEFPTDIAIERVHVPGALQALDGGDTDEHDRLIAAAAAAVREVDVIALAQFSMARALTAVSATTTMPVLATPDSAVRAMQRMVKSAAG